MKRQKKTEPVEIPWEARCNITKAIVLIHNCARYFEVMQILCELVGWEKNALTNQYDSIAERRKTRESFNSWVKHLTEHS